MDRNRTVTVHDGSFILLPNNRFAVVRLAVLAVTLRGPPVPDADPLEMYYDSTSDTAIKFQNHKGTKHETK